MKKILMFDVESTSLHGSAFAVGAIVKEFVPSISYEEYRIQFGKSFGWGSGPTSTKEELIKDYLDKCDKTWKLTDSFELLSLEGKEKAGSWVKENVLPSLTDMPTCNTDIELRTRFYDFYMKHKNAEIWSDCNFPVETNFLSAIVADNMEERQWNMPYPLKDVSTLVDINIDRVAAYPNQLRKHNPLDDSIASFYILIKTLNHETE